MFGHFPAVAEETLIPGQCDRDRLDRARRIGCIDLDALASARVLMVGAGAIGNETGKNLALSGFREVVVADMDTVATSNLARCLFFSQEDVSSGRFKADIVAEGMNRLDPDMRACAVNGRIQDLGGGFVGNFDLVLGCLDNVLARLHLNAECCRHGLPYVDAAMDGFRGKVQVVLPPETPCLECGMNRSHGRIVEQRFSCTGADVSLFLPKVGAEITTTSAVAAIQVREAVKICSALAGKCLHNVAYYDGLNNSLDILEMGISPECPNHA